MDKQLKQFRNLKIQPEEIRSATDNFDEKNNIGNGGFGKVYKGEVSHSKGRSSVAIKRLDDSNGQGDTEFLKEVRALSRYEHENLISLLGFCYEEGAEAILVYQLASRGSLEKYLGSTDLTWTLRLKICLGAAKGLRHLHDPRGTHQRLIHCDVKSANILLDDHWHAMVADFGFSTMGPANELHSTVVNRAAGTPGYCDPLYVETNTLTKESDVYSFGVVLVEVLCGALCFTIRNGSVEYNLVPTWIKSYEQKKLNDTIFKDLAIQPMHESVLQIFSDIAYLCLKESREDRPTMEDVVMELESALNIHELLQNPEFRAKWNPQSFFYKQMAKTAKPPLKYTSEDELKNLLSKGVLLNRGKTWFLLNKKGEHCEMISIAKDLGSEFKFTLWGKQPSRFPKSNSWRFPKGTYFSNDGRFITRVKTQFLSPGITYAVNLVFKFVIKNYARGSEPIFLKYKLHGETESSVSHLAYEREDGWWTVELYQLTSDHRIVDLQIQFEGFPGKNPIDIEGIEFRPLKQVEHKEDEQQPISDSDSDANWEEKLPTDYKDIMKCSKYNLQWATKDDVYSIIRKGFIICSDDRKGRIWFSLDKNGKKCHMLSAKYTWGRSGDLFSLPESRFGKALHCNTSSIQINHEIQSQLVSFETTYATYLVYKLPEDQSGFEDPIVVKVMDSDWYIYLVSPQTPVFKPKADQNTHNPLNKWITKPQQRNDGWMEVKICTFRTATTTEIIPMNLQLAGSDNLVLKKFSGLIIDGIEIRPI